MVEGNGHRFANESMVGVDGHRFAKESMVEVTNSRRLAKARTDRFAKESMVEGNGFKTPRQGSDGSLRERYKTVVTDIASRKNQW